MEDNSIVCSKCQQKIFISSWPFCPHGKGSNNVIADEIPGGVWIRHGICNEDGTPRKYYSKSEMAKEAAKRGLINNASGKADAKPNVKRAYST